MAASGYRAARKDAVVRELLARFTGVFCEQDDHEHGLCSIRRWEGI
jgi:hypothetical protein